MIWRIFSLAILAWGIGLLAGCASTDSTSHDKPAPTQDEITQRVTKEILQARMNNVREQVQLSAEEAQSSADEEIDPSDEEQNNANGINNNIRTQVSISNGDENGSLVITDHRLGVIGEIEPIVLLPSRAVMTARIDSGATTSSIDARDIEKFERDGRSWVRFQIHPGDDQEPIPMERPITRSVRIREHGGGLHERYVVELKIGMGQLVIDREFTLADRSNFNFPMLIGRNVLRGTAVIDVSRRNTLNPEHAQP